MVGGQPRWVDLPHEPGERVQIRTLNWRQEEEAEREGLKAAVAVMATLGDLSGAMEAFTQSSAAAAARRDRRARFDRATVLRYGLVGWSYEAPLTPESLEELDGVTAEFAFRQILRLDETPAEAEADRKNA